MRNNAAAIAIARLTGFALSVLRSRSLATAAEVEPVLFVLDDRRYVVRTDGCIPLEVFLRDQVTHWLEREHLRLLTELSTLLPQSDDDIRAAFTVGQYPTEQAIRAAQGTLDASVLPRHVGPVGALDAFRHSLCKTRGLAFAQALSERLGVPAVGMKAISFTPGFRTGSMAARPCGFVHSAVLHDDGTAQDAWGRLGVQRLLDRHRVEQAAFCADSHREQVDMVMRLDADRFVSALENAKSLVA